MIILEQEIETNIPRRNDCFSNRRYLRLIENHYLFLYNYNWFAKTNFFLYQEWYRSFVIIPGFWKIKINFGSHIISFIWMIETFIWFSINRRYLVFEKQRLLPEFVIISCSRIILSLIRFTKPNLIFYHELYIRFVIVPGFWKKHQFSFINISFIWMFLPYIWFSINWIYHVFEKQQLLPGIFVSISGSRKTLSIIKFAKPDFFL